MRFDRLDHLVRIPVAVGDVGCHFLFDTGIGVNVVSPELAERLGLTQVGETFVGHRMSGQRVESPLVYLPPLHVDGHVLVDHVAGVLDLDQEGSAPRFSGILGLTAFSTNPVTLDAAASTITLGAPGEVAHWVPLDIQTDGPSTAPYAQLELPSGRVITVEVDSGSACLILDTGWLERGDVEVSGSLETRTGRDETGFEWVRRRGNLKGEVHFSAAPETFQTGPTVIFQDIIHDGLLGADYLDRFRYTVDVGAARLGLSPLSHRRP